MAFRLMMIVGQYGKALSDHNASINRAADMRMNSKRPLMVLGNSFGRFPAPDQISLRVIRMSRLPASLGGRIGAYSNPA